jgi:hypothetical protein
MGSGSCSRRSSRLQETDDEAAAGNWFGSFFLAGLAAALGGERAWEAAPSIEDDDGEWAAAGGAAGCSRR